MTAFETLAVETGLGHTRLRAVLVSEIAWVEIDKHDERRERAERRAGNPGTCAYCRGPLPAGSRSHRQTCCDACRKGWERLQRRRRLVARVAA